MAEAIENIQTISEAHKAELEALQVAAEQKCELYSYSRAMHVQYALNSET